MAFDWRYGLFVAGCAAAFALALWATGWVSPWIVPDTAGYLAVAPYPEFYGQQRLPFYGWLADWLGGGQSPYLVWLHLGVHVAAALLLCAGVRVAGGGRGLAASLFLAALLSQGFVIFGRALVPEPLAVSCVLIAMAFTLIAASVRHWFLPALLAGLAAAAACLLRPMFLPLPLVLPVLLVLAGRIAGQPLVLRRAVAVLLLSLVPLLGYMADRGRHTGDFKPVAYGGFQLAGMAALMLSPDMVQRFPELQRELAAHILAQREKAEAEGKVIRTPANSSGERSFVSAAAGYFDIFARTHDDLLYGVIAGMQRPGETWAAFDRRLQRFAFTAIVLAPDRYAAWVAGAASRLAGRAIVTNAPFVLAFLGLIAVFLVLTIRNPGAIRSLPGTTDTLLGVTVVALYVAAAAPLAVLLTFPASRYIDSAAILLPALPLFAAIRLASVLRRPAGGGEAPPDRPY